MADERHDLRLQLQRLLAVIGTDERLSPELARAQREFLGPDRATEHAATRFAEWFLLERESELLGTIPIEYAAAAGEDAGHEALRGSRAGVFVVEAAGVDVLRLRDVQDNARLECAPAGAALRPGDVVVGRLYRGEQADFVASPAVGVIHAAPELAAAIRRDVERLGLERRLTQAELEHLVFGRIGLDAPAAPPLEHLEAELHSLLVAAGADDDFHVPAISAALRAAERPGVVSGPLLEQLAFDTDIDLERAGRLLHDIWSAQRGSITPAAPAGNPAPAPARTERETKRSAGHRIRPDEPLGAQLARRIEEGLANAEDVEELFADVAGMLGENIDEPDGDDPAAEPGDLEPLVREFAWEHGLDGARELVLGRFCAVQREAPVPRLDLEYVGPDDVSRFLLELWLGSPPAARVQAVRDAFALLQSFYAWVEESQGYQLGDVLAAVEQSFVGELDRLARAGEALAPSAAPPEVGAAPVRFAEVVDIEAKIAHVLVDEPRAERPCAVGGSAARELRPGDVLLGAFVDDGGVLRPTGPIVVAPGPVRGLFGP